MGDVDSWSDWVKLKHKQFQSCLKNKKWVIDKCSSDLLCDQITFTLFAETKYIYTDEENETLEAMATEVTKCNNSSGEDLHVSLIFKCVKKETENKNKEEKPGALIPIIRFKKPSDSHFYFRDYTTENPIFVQWSDIESRYKESGYAFSLPVNGDYNNNDCIIFPGGHSKEKYPNFNLDIECKGWQQYSVEELKKLFENIDGIHAAETARQSVQVLFLNCSLKSGFVSDLITDNLKPKEKHDVFKVLLKGFSEVSGKARETLGRANFIKDFVALSVHSDSFSKIQVISGSLLELPNELKLDAKAFVQLMEKERMLLFKPVNKDLKNHSDYTTIISKYNFILDFQLPDAVEKICHGLKVATLNAFEINGLLICKNLQPFEIKRLQTVLENTCKKFNTEYINLGVELGKKFNVQNLNQFCAMLEFAALCLNEKVDSIVQADKDYRRENKVHNAKKKSPDVARHEAYQELLKNIDDLYNQFKELVLISENCSKNKIFKFGDPMLAAYHFKKHSTENKNLKLTLETYIQIAQEILSRKDLESKWVQNGSVRCYYIYDEEYKASAIRYGNSIATLMFKNIFKQ